jgi:hypothetical protein
MPPSLPPLNRRCPVSSSPLTPLKPTGIKTPPPPASSPPLHHLPVPINAPPPPPLYTTLAAPLLRSSPCPQSPNTEHHRYRLLLLTAGLTPPLPRSPKPVVRTDKIPSIFFCRRGKLRALASSTSPHSGEAPLAFSPQVHRGPKHCPVYGLWTQSIGFSS